MPRLKPPPKHEDDDVVFKVDDNTDPINDVEITLGDVSVDEEVDRKPQVVKAAVKSNLVPDTEEEDRKKKEAEEKARYDESQRQLAEARRQQVEAQRALEEAQRQRDTERGDREQAQFDAVLTAIAAEQASLQKARTEYAIAANSGSWAEAADAQQAMAQAAARLDRLEDGKRAFEMRREEEKQKPTAQAERPQPQQRRQTLDDMIAGLPAQAQTWLRAHPEFMTDASQNAKIQSAHGYITNNRGIAAWTPSYFDALDEEFGFKKKEASPDHTPSTSARRSVPVTAPVSREVPSSSGSRQGSITLTPEQRRIARASFGPIIGEGGVRVDLTNEQKERKYAENLLKLRAARQSGEYPHTMDG